MLRHPVLLAFDGREIEAQLKARARNARIPAVYTPFDDDGYALRVPLDDLRRFAESSQSLLQELERRLRPLAREDERLRAWAEIRHQRLDTHPGRHQVLLFTWSRQLPPEAFASKGFELSRVFIHWIASAGSPTDALADTRARSLPSLNGLAKVLRNTCAPVATLDGLQQMAVDLQQEQDHDDLFRYFAPRVLALAMALFPASCAPAALGAVVTAIGGFLEFMQSLEDAQADGDITDAEVDQAWWAMLGILPFRVAQLGLMARGLGLIAHTFINLLLDGLAALPDLIERRLAAHAGGWNGYGEYDPETTVFLPAYAAV